MSDQETWQPLPQDVAEWMGMPDPEVPAPRMSDSTTDR